MAEPEFEPGASRSEVRVLTARCALEPVLTSLDPGLTGGRCYLTGPHRPRIPGLGRSSSGVWEGEWGTPPARGPDPMSG